MVSGLKGAGKDYISAKLQEQIEDSVVMAIAEPMKDIIATTMGISLDELDKYKNDKESLFVHVDGFDDGQEITNFRSILQRFGTEAMKKHFGDDVWVDLLTSKMPPYGTVIISDWRFHTEYIKMRWRGGVNLITLRVEDFNLTGDGHISEHDLDGYNFDFRIDNTAKDDSYIEQMLPLLYKLGVK